MLVFTVKRRHTIFLAFPFQDLTAVPGIGCTWYQMPGTLVPGTIVGVCGIYGGHLGYAEHMGGWGMGGVGCRGGASGGGHAGR